MKFEILQSLEDIARILNCDYIGNAEFPVLGMNEIHVVENGDIVFVDHPKYYDKVSVDYHFYGSNLDEDKINKAVKLSVDKYCGVIGSSASVPAGRPNSFTFNRNSRARCNPFSI